MKKANEFMIRINDSVLYFWTKKNTAKEAYNDLLKKFENDGIDVSDMKFEDGDLRDVDGNIIDKLQINQKNRYRYYDRNHDCEGLYEAYQNGIRDERACILKAIEENNKE